jgi:transposase
MHQVRRARLILLLDEGASRQAIVDELRCDSRFITTWKTRFASERLAGLSGRHLSRAPRRDLARLEARVLEYTLRRSRRQDVAQSQARRAVGRAVHGGATHLAQARNLLACRHTRLYFY